MSNMTKEPKLVWDCICVPPIAHKARLPQTYRAYAKNGTVVGYDGKCAMGTVFSRTFLTTQKEVKNPADGGVRMVTSTDICEPAMREEN